jgi:hypothetical protein
MADWLARYGAPAVALGIPLGGPTSSAAQLSRRSCQSGLRPDLSFFLGPPWRSVRLGAVSGAQLVLDASLLPAWYRRDPDARLAGRRRGRPSWAAT